MKMNEWKNVYPEPPEAFHNAVLGALCKLDEKAQTRVRYRRRAVKIALVCAVAAALGTATAVAANTQMFGLLRESVGNYGLKLSVTDEPSKAHPASDVPKHVKPTLGYIPQGYSVVPNTDGMKYLDGKVDNPSGFSLWVSRAEEFSYTEDFVVDSYETAVNGNRLIIATRQREENGSLDYVATEYFEDWGFVLSCIAFGGMEREELVKVMEGASLEEDKDYVEETLPEDYSYDEKREAYRAESTETYEVKKLGESFGWAEYADENTKPDDFRVKVTSVEQRDSAEGLDRELFMANGSEYDDYDAFFNADGTLMDTYTRTDSVYGDGISTQDKTWTTEATRHFYVVTVEVTSNVTPDEDHFNWYNVPALRPAVLSNDGKGSLREAGEGTDGIAGKDILHGNAEVVFVDRCDDYNLARIEKGETRTFTYGVIVDDDVAANTYLTMTTQSSTVSDVDQAVYFRYRSSCVKLAD